MKAANEDAHRKHPLAPFLPDGARILMLGSFPPKEDKWSMRFFYPNWINDMWRIVGTIFYGNKHHFEVHSLCGHFLLFKSISYSLYIEFTLNKIQTASNSNIISF
ncbi:MAG: hypothetical protein IKM47_06825 [Bacteroidaceae bacterium]|nr:hypothetical protein [Bacteroidaceae bacterium]